MSERLTNSTGDSVNLRSESSACDLHIEQTIIAIEILSFQVYDKMVQHKFH